MKGLKFTVFLPLLVFALSFIYPHKAKGQIIPVSHQQQFTDSLRQELINAPYFTLFKDNYFTVGTSLFHEKPSKYNSDVKFQISIAQRLTRTTLPWNSFIFLMYTQKTMWNVFQNSMPMRDMNFNPGIGWSIPFFSKGRYAGKATVLIEHESNGRDGEESRSWNRISFSASTIIDRWLTVHAKFWIPIVDGMNNRDLLKYAGIAQSGVQITTPDKKFGWSILLVKRKGWNLNFNTTVEFNWRIHEKSNQYLFVQYYNGYAENLLDYNQFHSRLRAGIVIKPRFFSEF